MTTSDSEQPPKPTRYPLRWLILALALAVAGLIAFMLYLRPPAPTRALAPIEAAPSAYPAR